MELDQMADAAILAVGISIALTVIVMCLAASALIVRKVYEVFRGGFQ